MSKKALEELKELLTTEQRGKGTKYTKKDFEKFYKKDQQVISQANKGLPEKVKFLEWYIEVGKFTRFITEYIDGEGNLNIHTTVL